MAQAFTDPQETEYWVKGKAANHLNLRHVALIRRHAVKDGSKAARWRPVKRHRVHAQKWIAMRDNMVRVGTGAEGLVHFQRKPRNKRQNVVQRQRPQLAPFASWPGPRE